MEIPSGGHSTCTAVQPAKLRLEYCHNLLNSVIYHGSMSVFPTDFKHLRRSPSIRKVTITGKYTLRQYEETAAV